MVRKKAWIALVGAVLTGSTTLAQGPNLGYPPPPSIYGNPGAYGYPGYPMPPQGPGAPVGPGAMPMVPGLPPGYAPQMGPVGLVPSAPPGYLPPTSPTGPFMPLPPGYRMPGLAGPTGGGNPAPYTNGGHQPGATQPYLVSPEPKTAPSAPAMEKIAPPQQPAPTRTLQPFHGGPIDAECLPAAFIDTDIPSEPYTLYEGRRYLAEAKLDHTRVWIQAGFIHWWVSRPVAPPLVTTSTGNIPEVSGSLGLRDTTTLLEGSIGPKEFSGARGAIGYWLDCDHLQALEIAGFWLGKQGSSQTIGSDATGSPLLTRPLQNAGAAILPGQPTGEWAYLIAAPGAVVGNITIQTATELHGAELNFLQNIYRLNGWSFDVGFGARYAFLGDSFTVTQNSTALPGFVIGLPGLGFGTSQTVYDSFGTINRFFGSQVIGRLSWTHCRFDATLGAKLALGVNRQNTTIDGYFLSTDAGVTQAVARGAYTSPANIGEHTSTPFAIVSEVNAAVGYQIWPCVRVQAGYDVMYWSNVQRAANQVNRSFSSPTYSPVRSDFWAHGLNLGLELTF